MELADVHASAAVIVRALRERRLIRFNYRAHSRLVEPHALGYRGGDLQLLGLQVGGGSDRPIDGPQWKAFSLSKMAEPLGLLEPATTFHPGRAYEATFEKVIATI